MKTNFRISGNRDHHHSGYNSPNSNEDDVIHANETQNILQSLFTSNKKDRHIEVVKPGMIGSMPNFAKAVTRGGLGEAETYSKLKSDMLKSRKLFEDPDFPANQSSICYTSQRMPNFVWKRPHEICSNPKFVLGGLSRFDVVQGELGDCWLLAAVSCLSMQPMLMTQVVPQDQSFSQTEYCGAFRFHFWHYGKWKEVIVDDRLPTRNNKLVFMQSKENNEFWSALLEKAYAKLYGTYELLKGGSTVEAMEDFTGGISELLDIKDDYRGAKDEIRRQKLFEIMQQSHEKMSMMGTSIEGDPRQVEARLSSGLVRGHAYSITDVKEIKARVPGYNGPIKLIRVRNPWGQVEWKGKWSDESECWKYITDRDRGQLGLNFENDGEFWMSFEDFITNFEKLEICHLGPQSLGEILAAKKNNRKWEATVHCGQWKPGVSAGGCLNYKDSFWTNPQFRIKIEDPDKKDDDNQGTVMIGLMQKNTRSIRNRSRDLNTIGYVIYRITDEQPRLLSREFFRFNRKVAASPNFINLREVCGRHRLNPGSYVIIPSTFEPNKEGEFLLRVFAERALIGAEMDEESGLDKKNVTYPIPIKVHYGGIKPEPVKEDFNKLADKEVQNLRKAFEAIAGEDMEVDSGELQQILNASFRNERFFKEFTLDTCRSIVAMLDSDLSGRLGFDEFLLMWRDLKIWKTVFKKHDEDESGSLNSYELRELLNEIGFRVSNKVFSCLVQRYTSTDNHTMLFDDFIHCCVRLSNVFSVFQNAKKYSKHEAIIDQESFLQNSIYS